jgi:siroheme synthase-like protein
MPLFASLAGAKVVLTGSGPASDDAERRLRGHGAAVVRASGPDAVAQLGDAWLLVAASEDPAADEPALRAATERRVWSASATGAAAPAFLGEAAASGRVVVAVTTSGCCPALEQRLLQPAREALVPEHDRLAEILGSLRGKLEARYPDAERREQIWQDILDSPVLGLLQQSMDDEAVELAERMAWGTG